MNHRNRMNKKKEKEKEKDVSKEYNDTAMTSNEKTPSMTLTNILDSPSSSPFLTKRSSSLKTPIKMRDLRDIYEKTNKVEKADLFCLYRS